MTEKSVTLFLINFYDFLLTQTDNYTEVFKAIEENRADAGITNRNFGNKNAKNFEVKKTPIIFQPINIKFAFPKEGEQTPLLEKKNKRLHEKIYAG